MTDLFEKEENPATTTEIAPTNMLSTIERMAANPEVDVQKLQALLNMQKDMLRTQSEIEFNQAMARMQKDMPSISKDGSVEYEKNGKKTKAFDFATFENIMTAVKPSLEAEGFYITFNCEISDVQGKEIISGTLHHQGGFERTVRLPMALDMSGGKNAIQGMGSTLSYGKRYCVIMLLNIVTHGEDNDGNLPAQCIDDDEINKIRELFMKTGTIEENFLSHFKINNIEDLQRKDYPAAINILKTKLAKIEDMVKNDT